MVIIDFGEFIVVLILTYYTIHIIKMLFSKNQRIEFQNKNLFLDELRAKPIKSIEEQKNFINTKYPKIIGNSKWSWKSLPKVLLSIILFILVYRIYFQLILKINYDIKIWQGIIFIIIFPIIINLILEKFNIHKGDITVFLGGKKK